MSSELLEKEQEQAGITAERQRSVRVDRRPWGSIRRMMGRVVPDDVWHNWRWDAGAAVCAGIYQGAVWTFALQLARGALRATGPMMALATAAPAIGVLFAAFWAR